MPVKTVQPSANAREGTFQALAGKLRTLIGLSPRASQSAHSARRSAHPPGALQTILLPQARTRWLGPRARDMTPHAIEGLLRDAITSRTPRREQELYQLMVETWPRLLKNTSEVKNAVLGLDWSVLEPADDALTIPGHRPIDRALLTRARNGMRGNPVTGTLGWEDTLRALLEARFRGTSTLEILWKTTPTAILPAATIPLTAWHYGWNPTPTGHHSTPQPAATDPAHRRDGQLVLYPDAGLSAGNAQDFTPGKFLIALDNATSAPHPSAGALLRPLTWSWCAANFSREWLLNFAQIFGQPYRWATYAPGDESAKTALAAAMENMASAAWGVGPAGSAVEFVETRRGAGDNPQHLVLQLADTACDLLILGQTLTTDVGDSGSRALGDVHHSVRADIIDAAAAWLAGILNDQLVPHIARHTLGRDIDIADLPYFEASRKERKNTKDLAETYKTLHDIGIDLPADWLYETLDIPRPAPGDDIIPGAPPGTAPGVGDHNLQSPTSNLAHQRSLSTATDQQLRAAIARLPLDARSYILARLPQPPPAP